MYYSMYILQPEHGHNFRVLILWVFGIAESLVSVGVIFYASKGVRTSSATVLRYVTGYAACKIFLEWFINSSETLRMEGPDIDDATIIVFIIALVLQICLAIHYIDVFRSLANEFGADQGETRRNPAAPTGVQAHVVPQPVGIREFNEDKQTNTTALDMRV